MDLPALPPRILFVGGGFISFEFAHNAARAGSTAVILDRGPRPLKAFDPDLVELLISRGAGSGIQLWRSTTITSIEKSGTSYRVSMERSGRHETAEVDLVVHGAGRVAELSGLDLDAAGVEWDGRGVRVAPICRAPATRPSTLPGTRPTARACP
jgi:glutathione reductase (NADPH)